jgi:predicted XRE-type DNA-binding protein
MGGDWRAKLTAEQVIDIYLLARSKRYWQRELAEAFGISQSEVSLIEHRRRWHHLF